MPTCGASGLSPQRTTWTDKRLYLPKLLRMNVHVNIGPPRNTRPFFFHRPTIHDNPHPTSAAHPAMIVSPTIR
jgi:hypothetical protein